MTVRVKGKVWKYPGIGGWHFFTVNQRVSRKMRNFMHGRLRGFGSIRVQAHIGKSEWKTSVFPTKSGTYLLPVKADVRRMEEIGAGDTINLVLTLVTP